SWIGLGPSFLVRRKVPVSTRVVVAGDADEAMRVAARHGKPRDLFQRTVEVVKKFSVACGYHTSESCMQIDAARFEDRRALEETHDVGVVLMPLHVSQPIIGVKGHESDGLSLL